MHSTRLRSLLLTLSLLGGTPRPSLADAPATPCIPSDGSLAVSIGYEQPGTRRAESLAIRVDYPADRVSMGHETAADDLLKRIEKKPANTIAGASATRGSLKLVLSRAAGFEPDDLVIIRFDRCTGAAAPPSDAFRCTVDAAGSRNGAVPEAACKVRAVQ